MEPTKDTAQNSSEQQAEAGNEEIQGLQKRITDLEAEVKEKEAKYLYLYAEFENFKKRSIKERSDLLKFGWESAARDLLQVVDNLERALAHFPASADKSWVEGIQMVLQQFLNILSQQGIQRVETIQKPFDPHLHEAVGQEESALPAETITQELSRGYTLHGRLLRPARVIVSSGVSNGKAMGNGPASE